MTLLCEQCDNILEIKTEETIEFHCNGCNKTYEATPEDTLRYKKNSQTPQINDHIIKLAIFVPTNPIYYKTCLKCKQKRLVVQIEYNRNGLAKNICKTCNYNWFEFESID